MVMEKTANLVTTNWNLTEQAHMRKNIVWLKKELRQTEALN